MREKMGHHLFGKFPLPRKRKTGGEVLKEREKISPTRRKWKREKEFQG